MPPSPRIPGSMHFRVSPDELATLVTVWLNQSEVVSGIDVDALHAVTGTSSRVLAALRATARPARLATASIADRLASMGFAVRTFRLDSDAADRATARSFAAMADR